MRISDWSADVCSSELARLAARTGVGRACDGAGGGAAGDLDRARSGKPGAGVGQLRVGGVRRGVRPAGAGVAVLEAHEPQRPAGGDAGDRKSVVWGKSVLGSCRPALSATTLKKK